ncbi:MAG: bifunctional 4-hydroxy-2-oxoglutarate aldolase/2-dehydro-3-deoxy-phosphogluconate aldolase [Bacteroidota bacterium]|jgi:2-dehydro-3-deoxyphosphogluconate aldolase/(4S)-4-hydroxy-2-oxoglutarate aldolase|nr:bifunctional 4-hydroxy-2-oxoglutarate aldolase/2-dehydro-3-deoxy-phosphogluconate aldolase [Bacteroidota bacterium]
MSGFKRINVALAMEETGLVPLFYHPDPQVCREVITACHTGGANVFEFANRGDFAHEVFADVRKWALRELPGMMIGAGSVPDAPTAAIFMQMGADFIVSPSLNPEVARICNRRKVLWIPGCGTVTEISQAEELGAEIVKIFPGNAVGGPSFVKAVKGPCPWTSIMPTGGVEPTEENLSGWFAAGVTCVGMGSALVTERIVKEKNWKSLESAVRETLNTIKKLRPAIT